MSVTVGDLRRVIEGRPDDQEIKTVVEGDNPDVVFQVGLRFQEGGELKIVVLTGTIVDGHDMPDEEGWLDDEDDA